MALLSSVPKIQFTDAGLVIPTDAEVLAGVQADIDAAFGGGTNPALETPQGQLATSQAAATSDKNSQIALMVNQFDPQYASGRWQDGLARIYFLTRQGAAPTVVQATLTGVAGTLIPAGTLAQDTSGNTYISMADATITATGTVTASFENLVTGPIACPAGTLTKVYKAIPGWDAITNPGDGVLGRNVETQQDFEYRRQNSVQINGNGTPGAIYANVFAVPGVLDCYAIDNGGPAVNKGATNYPLAANSMYVAVVGGADADIAKAIWQKKDGGCTLNGNTTVTVKDTSGYSYPEPTYSIKFERPAALPIKFAVQLVNNPSLPANIVQLVQDAIIARFTGADGSARERIGATVFSGRYYAAVSAVSSVAEVISILIGTTTATLTSVSVGIDQVPTISAADISVTLV